MRLITRHLREATGLLAVLLATAPAAAQEVRVPTREIASREAQTAPSGGAIDLATAVQVTLRRSQEDRQEAGGLSKVTSDEPHRYLRIVGMVVRPSAILPPTISVPVS